MFPDSKYYRWRAEVESKMATTATNRVVAEVHRLMAEEYSRRAMLASVVISARWPQSSLLERGAAAPSDWAATDSA